MQQCDAIDTEMIRNRKFVGGMLGWEYLDIEGLSARFRFRPIPICLNLHLKVG